MKTLSGLSSFKFKTSKCGDAMYGNQRENIHLFSRLSVTDVLVWGQNGKHKVPKFRIFYMSSMMKNKTKSKTKTGK